MRLKGKVVLLLSLICAGTGAFGQNDEEVVVHRHQIGFNSTLFVKQFLSFSNNTIIADNPYLLTYKHLFDNNMAIRGGLGLNYQFQKQSLSSVPNAPDSTVSNYYFRIGYEKQYSVTKHWLFYAGVDVRLEREKSISETTVTPVPQNQVSTITNRKLGVGLGPILGVEYKINNRISFNAEGSLLYFYNETHKEVEDSRFPSLKSDDFIAKNSISATVPTTIYFILKL